MQPIVFDSPIIRHRNDGSLVTGVEPKLLMAILFTVRKLRRHLYRYACQEYR